MIDKFKFLKELKKLHAHIKDYQKFSEYIIFKKQLKNESLSSKTFFWKNISTESSQRRIDNSETIETERLSNNSTALSLIFFEHIMTFSTSESTNDSANIIDRNQRNVESQQHEWADVFQENWNNFQKIIQFMNAVNQIIQSTLKALQAIIIFNQRSQNMQQQSQQNMSQNIVQITQSNSRWNAANLEFFDSLYDEKFSAIENAIEHSEKNIYFRDVHIFIERIKNIAQINRVAAYGVDSIPFHSISIP